MLAFARVPPLWCLLALPLGACGAGARSGRTTEAKTNAPHAPAIASTPVVAEGIATRSEGCSAQDGTCNAIDEDCDGAIDEGCGYRTGEVQVTLAWSSGADLDLYVTDPSGEAIFFNREHRSSPAGGRFDHDSRGDCRPEQTHPGVENAYWPAPAPRGEYSIELHYFSPCGAAGATRATLSVAVGGKLLGSYEYDLSPEERIPAVHFSIP